MAGKWLLDRLWTGVCGGFRNHLREKLSPQYRVYTIVKGNNGFTRWDNKRVIWRL